MGNTIPLSVLSLGLTPDLRSGKLGSSEFSGGLYDQFLALLRLENHAIEVFMGGEHDPAIRFKPTINPEPQIWQVRQL